MLSDVETLVLSDVVAVVESVEPIVLDPEEVAELVFVMDPVLDRVDVKDIDAEEVTDTDKDVVSEAEAVADTVELTELDAVEDLDTVNELVSELLTDCVTEVEGVIEAVLLIVLVPVELNELDSV